VGESDEEERSKPSLIVPSSSHREGKGSNLSEAKSEYSAGFSGLSLFIAS
jgi:hypothetical protein